MGEPRFVAIGEPPEETVGEEGRRREGCRTLVLDLQGRDRVGEVVSLRVQPLQPGQLPTAHVENRVESGQYALVRGQAWVVRVVDRARVDALIGVAEQGGGIP